jgi:hypothetical protein
MVKLNAPQKPAKAGHSATLILPYCHPQPCLPARHDDRAPALHRPPSFDQTQPECPVAVISRGGGETAAFIGTPFEFIMAAVADDPERESLNGGVLAEHDAGSLEDTISNANRRVLMPLATAME